MPKTNFTKVEEAFIDGLRKIEVEKLLRIADENSSDKKTSKIKSPPSNEQSLEQKKLLITLRFELKNLVKETRKEVYEKLGIEASLLDLLKETTAINAEDFEKLKALKEKIVSHKEELANIALKQKEIKESELKNIRDFRRKPVAEVENKESNDLVKKEEIFIEKQRKDQKTKRFNINQNWIPLR